MAALQLSTTFKGISLPTAYAKILGVEIRGEEQRLVVHVALYATAAAYAEGASNRLADNATYEFKDTTTPPSTAWTTFVNGLPNLGAANSGKNPLTLAYAALKTVAPFIGATDVA